MAKLGSYYGLCPLIESKSLLGISEDPEKGIVIVTLGKNIAGRYKLSDQKQVSCWKTKEKFSSPVIYDKKSSKYVAVFNRSYIRLWEDDEENLDKLKKYKFSKSISTIFSSNDNTFVLFDNGDCFELENALESRKVLNSDESIAAIEKIDDIIYLKLKNQFYLGLIVKISNNSYLYWTECNTTHLKFNKISLQRDNFNLRGYILHVFENALHLLTIWSDGRIFSYSLEDSQEETFPGQLFSVVEHISTKYSVSTLTLDENYIAMFGANSNEEGAMLIIYNTQFKVVQSKQSFKLFTNDAKLWNYENNLLLPVGQILAVIPYFLETEQLAALVGSHKMIQMEMNTDVAIVQEFEIGEWDPKEKLEHPDIPEALTYKINYLLKQGLPENLIMEELLLKKPNTDSLSECIDYFFDIPEKYLAKLLKHLIILDEKQPHNDTDVSKSEVIDKILSKPFSEIILLPYLRSEFTLEDSVKLLNYLCFLLSDEGHLLPHMNVIDTQAKLIEWCFVIIDANYQKLLLSRDNCVQKVLDQINKLVEQHLNSFEDLKFLSSVLNYFKTEISKVNSIGISNIKYSVEQICFY